MKEKNGFLVREKNDLREYFHYLDEEIKYPKYLQKIILKILFNRLGIDKDNFGDKLEDVVGQIPEEYLEAWIGIIDNLYNEEKKVNYDGIEDAYLAYYLPVNTFKIHKLLRDLACNNLLKTNVQILDLACGPGSVSIGIIEFYKRLAEELNDIKFQLSITLLDCMDSFIEIAKTCIKEMKKHLPSNLQVDIVETKCCEIDENFKLKYMYDYIVISNLLNSSELDGTFGLKNFFGEVISSLKKKGALFVIEPGDEKQCERLKKIRNKVLESFEDVNMYSPCVDIWNQKSKYTCNCFTAANINWRRPKVIDRLKEIGLVKSVEHIAFNYAIFRKDGKTKYTQSSELNGFTMIKDLASNTGRSVNVKGIVRFVNKGKSNYLISICDGSDSMNSKHANISVSYSNGNLIRKYSKIIESMNVGDMIEAKGVTCCEMRYYKGSFFLNANDNTEFIFRY